MREGDQCGRSGGSSLEVARPSGADLGAGHRAALVVTEERLPETIYRRTFFTSRKVMKRPSLPQCVPLLANAWEERMWNRDCCPEGLKRCWIRPLGHKEGLVVGARSSRNVQELVHLDHHSHVWGGAVIGDREVAEN